MSDFDAFKRLEKAIEDEIFIFTNQITELFKFKKAYATWGLWIDLTALNNLLDSIFALKVPVINKIYSEIHRGRRVFAWKALNAGLALRSFPWDEDWEVPLDSKHFRKVAEWFDQQNILFVKN